MRKVRNMILIVVLTMVIGIILPLNVKAEIASGTSGTCSWQITDNKELIIKPTSGEECDMANTTEATVPWYTNRSNIVSIKFEKKVYAPEIANSLFSYLSNLENIDFKNFDTSKVTSMYALFAYSSKISKLDLSGFNTSNVTSMRGMFIGCRNLTEVNLSSFDTSNVTNMRSMFNSCSKLKALNLTNFNTEKVTDFVTMFTLATGLQELDLSSFTINENTNIIGMLGDTEPERVGAKIIKFGDKVKISNKYGFIMRGTWQKKETGEVLTALKLYENMLQGKNVKGTYVQLSKISKDLKIKFPVDYKIEKFSKISGFSTTNDNFKLDSNNLSFRLEEIPFTDADSYVAPGKVELLFEDTVSDKNGHKYDLKMTFENITLYDVKAISGVDKAIKKIAGVKNQEIVLYGNNYYKNVENYNNAVLISTATTEPIVSSYDITLNILKKDGTPAEGNYIFSIYDMDVASKRDKTVYPNATNSNYGYGYYSEGVTLNGGFDMSNLITFTPNNILQLNNRITGKTRDGATELTEALVKADAKESKFTWTSGEGGDSTLLSLYQPKIVDIEKKDVNGNYLMGAKFELYYDNSKLYEWESSENPKKLFLNPGEYVLKEAETPKNHKKIDDIYFYIDVDDNIEIDGKTVEKVEVVNELEKYTYTVNYIDKETKEKIKKSKTAKDEYNTKIVSSEEIVDIEDYRYDSVDKDSIVIKEDGNVINIYYTKKAGKVIVKYVDKATDEEIIKSEEKTGKVGEDYKIEKKEIKGYTYVEVEGKEEGKYTEDLIEIVYYYKKEVNNPKTKDAIMMYTAVAVISLAGMIITKRFKKRLS